MRDSTIPYKYTAKSAHRSGKTLERTMSFRELSLLVPIIISKYLRRSKKTKTGKRKKKWKMHEPKHGCDEVWSLACHPMHRTISTNLFSKRRRSFWSRARVCPHQAQLQCIPCSCYLPLKVGWAGTSYGDRGIPRGLRIHTYCSTPCFSENRGGMNDVLSAEFFFVADVIGKFRRCARFLWFFFRLCVA